ncbi:hypothetical protein QNI19_22475 [Cytophagaceae bacterium DM2B3-1]|uniref:Phage tail protein n=1 Tax=Xanthocytophaga flava TaxID=3048013 RepID=A0ABT7CPQ1_9BACT|nr:hypothetical protein [Xanthocytophaga flavus]MDJ1471282.1 hypothetical protein [Xanthocytophaga flavus]MDJ1495719.1 hypothetical protein [Xanthocytophaga flavus]
MQTQQKHFVWYGSAGSEGGPFMISSVEDYAQWKGSDELLSERFRIRYDGPLVNELSPDFEMVQPIYFYSEASCKEFVLSLLKELYEKQPQLVMQVKKTAWDEVMNREYNTLPPHATPDVIEKWMAAWLEHIGLQYNFLLEDKTSFRLIMEAYTDYTQICEMYLNQDEIAIAPFGNDAQALFWDLRPNIVTLALEPTGSEVLFVTTQDIHKAKALEVIASSDKSYEVGTLNFPTGRGVLAWSPMTQGDLGAAAGLEPIADLNPPVQLNSLNILGVGTVFKVKAGKYAVTWGWDNVDEKEFAWIRISLKE